MISYSFHLSTEKHALTTCRKVSGASKHNLRKNESEEETSDAEASEVKNETDDTTNNE